MYYPRSLGHAQDKVGYIIMQILERSLNTINLDPAFAKSNLRNES